MKNFKVLLVLFSFVSILNVSCSKDDDDNTDLVKDLRDNVVGTYNYHTEMFIISDSGIYQVPDSNIDGTMIIKKNESNSSSIDFFEGGKLEFQGTKIEEASNGLAFDIPNQEMIDKEDGSIINIEAYPSWDLGGTKYTGIYKTDEKKILISFKVIYSDSDVSEELFVTYEATKQ